MSCCVGGGLVRRVVFQVSLVLFLGLCLFVSSAFSQSNPGCNAGSAIHDSNRTPLTTAEDKSVVVMKGTTIIYTAAIQTYFTPPVDCPINRIDLGQSFTVQWRNDTDNPTGAYTTLGTTGELIFATATGDTVLADSGSTTLSEVSPVAGSGTFIGGREVETSAGVTTQPNRVRDGEWTAHQIAIKTSNALVNKTYSIRFLVDHRDGTGAPVDFTTKILISSAKWRGTTGAATLVTPTVLVGNRVIGGDNNGDLFAFQVSDGATPAGWTTYTTPTGAVQGQSPVVPLTNSVGTRIFAGSLDGFCYAVNASTGAEVWVSDGDNSTAGAQALGDDVLAGPVVQRRNNAVPGNEDLVFCATRNAAGSENKIYAFKATDGSCVWVFNGTCAGGTGTRKVGQIRGRPVVDSANNRLYVTTAQFGTGVGEKRTLWVIDTGTTDSDANEGLVTGWQKELGDIDASPALRGTTLYVGANDGKLYAFTTTDGSLKWTGTGANSCAQCFGTGATGAFVTGLWADNRAPYNDKILFSQGDGTTRKVWMVRDPGAGPAPTSAVWTTTLSGAAFPLLIPTFPGGNPGKVYVGSNAVANGGDSKLHQLHPDTGTDEKQFLVGDNKEAGTIVVGGVAVDVSSGTQPITLFVGTDEGKVYALEVSSP